ncbi:MAG: 1-deoxy-D-xylulose-5-phosphate reductoisomerase [Bacteroidales bacterium]|nr:1-deoxy-D-xylulose-5-phosphate reductoisomerase [Bacteroidales bacterium]
MKKRIAILGSTGSIGKQALEIVRAHPDQLEVEVLTANSNADLLVRQAAEFRPNAVVIADDTCYHQVQQALQGLDIKVFSGRQSLLDIVEMSTIDMVLVALVGFAGLEPTYRAIAARKAVALANKETLVAGGALIMPMVRRANLAFLPVDSEHSAIFQCLAGECAAVEKILLTASGGPFFGCKRADLENVKAEQALKHPNWNMGNKVTIDSATMMNKGLEMIEAHWLFNVAPQQIEIVVQPQSIVHSMVEFADGSVKAQMSLPDMRIPIQYAFSFPYRWNTTYPKLSFSRCATLDFYEPDRQTFECIGLAYKAIERGGNIPCAMNAANESAVSAFLHDKITFLQIAEVVAYVMDKINYAEEASLDNFSHTDALSRLMAKGYIELLERK